MRLLTCAAVRRRLAAFHDRELPIGEMISFESHIKDWPSEYHLSSKRAQLLSGFEFDRKARVLEVGAGCAG